MLPMPIGDLVELGACLDDYQNQKLVMAPGKADRYNVLIADASVLWYRVNAKSCGSLSGEDQGSDSW